MDENRVQLESRVARVCRLKRKDLKAGFADPGISVLSLRGFYLQEASGKGSEAPTVPSREVRSELAGDRVTYI